MYTPAVLAVYDLYVLRFSNYLAWRCPTSKMLDLYNAHISPDHLDIGPGSGWYLAKTALPAHPAISLLDMNPNSLAMTTRRLRRRGVEPARHLGSVLQPLPLNHRFGSVAANFLMHCVPGRWDQKNVAFQHIAEATSDDGVFFGSTILGRGVATNLLADAISTLYNRVLHVFHNTDDDLAGLETALRAAFSDVQIAVYGSVATWAARAPRRDSSPA
ncbi:class I SAM-dependent methyltransferase [Nocardia amamiensis]|uniref:class I SAM-dependent methyltransferase n=1 Tax=Nocardia amamiensis TaxID=404578 RepID=UPI00082BCAA7|nr:class I SAM-dependent methyltransferase [Nocardia amamiensis]